MDRAQNFSHSECNTQSSEPLGFHTAVMHIRFVLLWVQGAKTRETILFFSSQLLPYGIYIFQPLSVFKHRPPPPPGRKTMLLHIHKISDCSYDFINKLLPHAVHIGIEVLVTCPLVCYIKTVLAIAYPHQFNTRHRNWISFSVFWSVPDWQHNQERKLCTNGESCFFSTQDYHDECRLLGCDALLLL
jgi:hypothetical protein